MFLGGRVQLNLNSNIHLFTSLLLFITTKRDNFATLSLTNLFYID